MQNVFQEYRITSRVIFRGILRDCKLAHVISLHCARKDLEFFQCRARP